MSDLITLSRELSRAVGELDFGPPVTHVYNPLEYARRPHEAYLARLEQGGANTVLLGMNPGPWGMAQTGVPFGEVAMVRDWLRIEEPVGRPVPEHPKRPIQGFECARSEVSGSRLWGWARDRYGSPGGFFRRFAVLNYCPLIFLEDSGRNRTPDRLPAGERKPLLEVCDRHLRDAIGVLRPDLVVGIGRFAESRARTALAGAGPRVGGMLHPSPASPAANRGWRERAEADLETLGVDFREHPSSGSHHRSGPIS